MSSRERCSHAPGLAVCVALAVLATPAPAAETLHTTVHLGDYRFRPDTVEIEAGRTVELTLVNEDGFTPHNFTLKGAGADLEVSADVKPGQSVSVRLTPTVPGTYEFWCDKKFPFLASHREKGMHGKLVVR